MKTLIILGVIWGCVSYYKVIYKGNYNPIYIFGVTFGGGLVLVTIIYLCITYLP